METVNTVKETDLHGNNTGKKVVIEGDGKYSREIKLSAHDGHGNIIAMNLSIEQLERAIKNAERCP